MTFMPSAAAASTAVPHFACQAVRNRAARARRGSLLLSKSSTMFAFMPPLTLQIALTATLRYVMNPFMQSKLRKQNKKLTKRNPPQAAAHPAFREHFRVRYLRRALYAAADVCGNCGSHFLAKGACPFCGAREPEPVDKILFGKTL